MKIVRPKSRQPLPEKATKVFSGKIFDVYQWKQTLYDGTTAIFEKLKRPDTVVVFLVLDNGKILLTKQEQPGKAPFITAAGGRVDPGESILHATERELLEETGYEAKKYVLWKSLQPVSKIEWAVYIFVAYGAKKVSNMQLDGGEKITLMEVSFAEFLEIAQQPDFGEKEIYRDVMEAMQNKDKMKKLKQLLSPQ